MNPRDKLFEETKKLLFGPNPLQSPYRQDNGEEILYGDSPLNTYVVGILFPQNTQTSRTQNDDDIPDEGEETPDGGNEILFPEEDDAEAYEEQDLSSHDNSAEDSDETDDTVSRIGCYKPSALGVTVCVPRNAESISVSFSGGVYNVKKGLGPRVKIERSDNGQIKTIERKEIDCWYRTNIAPPAITLNRRDLPDANNKRMIPRQFETPDGIVIELSVIFRMTTEDSLSDFYTIAAFNKSNGNSFSADKCVFQAHFDVTCESGFCPFPEKYKFELDDDDYKLNAMLYKDVKKYGIGHGCSADWDDSDGQITSIRAEVMPTYCVKPIKNLSFPELSFSMKEYSEKRDKTVEELNKLCDLYEKWISGIESTSKKSDFDNYREIANKQIDKCRQCLKRMRDGSDLLKTNDTVWKAFSLANKAMLMQQLHYNLPKTAVNDNNNGTFETINLPTMPDINNEETWYDRKTEDNPNGLVYGKWRAFQIAFILMNLVAMNDKDSADHKMIDLIWFPTGGGKTEAYLGLTAYSVFLRRLKNPNDAGTAVIMRYTLRLLTQQQFQRAASLICSMEVLRSKNPTDLGSNRITIGMWVGNGVTPNKEEDAAHKIAVLQGIGHYTAPDVRQTDNASPMVKCPYCGTTMETIDRKTPGYYLYNSNQRAKKDTYNKVLFNCANQNCKFHMDDRKIDDFKNSRVARSDIPIVLYDDNIYSNPPTLLIGTVDKFAVIPFKKESKNLFGGENISPPELIIQDELHLISGPLGSCVGMYETLVDWICTRHGKSPKIVASTATISHAAEQCNALFACGKENIIQFPVQGISYKDCFFAKEDDNDPGRQYVGIYGSNKQAETTISTFAALAYAAEELDDNAESRDPYWTNVAYFNSIKELGQISTWCMQDIKERLESTLYNKRLVLTQRRRLSESRKKELSSQVSHKEIPKVMDRLGVSYKTSYDENDLRPIDICLATNMIQVGLDIPRLGLMTVNGQPKSMSEYIQATSRIGRSKPGIVFVIYNISKSRDRSYYEQFRMLHSALYYHVDPSSLTPFSKPMRDRALPAVFIGAYRHSDPRFEDARYYKNPAEDRIREISEYISNRVSVAEPDEQKGTETRMKTIFEKWDATGEWSGYFDYGNDINTLLYDASKELSAGVVGSGWPAQNSMRNVDKTCKLMIKPYREVEEDDE